MTISTEEVLKHFMLPIFFFNPQIPSGLSSLEMEHSMVIVYLLLSPSTKTLINDS